MNSGPAPTPVLSVTRTAAGGYHVRNQDRIDEVVKAVREGHYCTILGPRYCQKTDLLKDTQEALERAGNEVCVFVDFRESQYGPDNRLLRNFATAVAQTLQELTDQAPLLLPSAVEDTQTLKDFLQGYLSSLKRDVVLLINCWERIHIGPLEALLVALRAIHNGRCPDDPARLGVVSASALSVAELALGPSSPFNIAHLVWLQDLSDSESRLLVDRVIEDEGAAMSPGALDHLLRACKGDRYLLPTLCMRCVQQVSQDGRTITEADIEQAIAWFLDYQTNSYPPLGETVLAIENDPFVLLNVLEVFERTRVPRNQLRIQEETVYDNLRLSGAVRVEGEGDLSIYCIRNEIYDKYLKRQFLPSRVVDVLRTSGHRDEAIAYLERLCARGAALRPTLLDTIIYSIQASADESVAYAQLADGLRVGFGAQNVRVYVADTNNNVLREVAQVGYHGEPGRELSLTDSSPLACRAHVTRHHAVNDDAIALPLLGGLHDPPAVVAIDAFRIDPHEERFHELQGFLRRARIALAEVADREHKLRSFEQDYERWSKAAGSLDLDQVLTATVEVAIKAVPKAQNAAVFLWDEKRQKHIISAQQGLPSGTVDLAQLSRGQGYVGWVYDNRRPVLIGDAQKDPLTAPVGDHTERSAVCVPLEAWGRVIGVLCLQNSTEYDAFQLRDVDLLYRVAGHAALTIQSTRVSAELYELGMRINRTDLSAEKIFRMVVQSIIKVCGAKAANMLLLRDTDDPALCLSQSPELGVSEGVPADFNQQTRPRPDGLTACALKTRHPCFVRNPDDAPGLNPLVTKHEIQACICLPLLLQDVIIGVLFVYYGEKHDFSKREIRILSLFANQTALAIQNAKQSERLKITASVVWMGIGFSTMAHRITQKTSAIKDAVYYLRRVLGDRGDIVERLSQIDLYAEALAGIPRAALLPLVEIPEPVDLSIILKQEIPRWCLGAAVVPDLMGLADGEILVNVDQKRLAFLLEILTTNAVRAMKDSALKMLRVSSVVRGGRVRVIMSDTGRPIPEEVRKILFKEPVPKPPGAEGTGVGLLIARSIVNSYGGEIDVLDTNPTETVFYFDLPTCRRTAEA